MRVRKGERVRVRKGERVRESKREFYLGLLRVT